MIDRHIVLDCAEVAGFGGQTRNVMLPRLLKFAALIAQKQRHIDAEHCSAIGKSFADGTSEFSDGQMDGAFKCADSLEKRHG